LVTRKKKVGLALSGGAARGFAHIGVLGVLQQEGIPIDMIAGTSAGAVMGAIYAAGRDTREMIEQAVAASGQKLTLFIDPCLPRTGFLKGRKIKNLLSGFIGGNIKFTDLKIPFACVATDIYTGEEVIMDSGLVLDALRATISIPGIFTVFKHEGRYLVDGGLTTPVPVNVVKQMGADFVIAVNVNHIVSDHIGKASQKRLQAHKEPTLLQILMQSFYITTFSLAHRSLAAADIVIEPYMPHINSGDFSKVEEMIAHGHHAAHEALPEIKRKLSELELL
jgi:NTE family protein